MVQCCGSWIFIPDVGHEFDGHLTNGSGSGSRRPKNIKILIRIQIRNTGKYCTWTMKAMQKTEAARLGENRCLTPLSDNRRLNKQKFHLQHQKFFCFARRQQNAFSQLVQKNAKF
jgi:hypothetical protein